MRFSRTHLTVSAAALAAVLASGGVVAQGDHGSVGAGMHGGGEGMHGDGAKGSMRGRGMGSGMGHGGRMVGHGGMMMRGLSPYMAGVLGLSEEQEARIEEIQKESGRAHGELMQQMHERHRALMQLQRERDPAPEAVGEAFARVSAVKRQMVEQHVRMRSDIRGVLDEQQQEHFERMRRHHGAMH